jgi:uncharacterized membrane protein YkgB
LGKNLPGDTVRQLRQTPRGSRCDEIERKAPERASEWLFGVLIFLGFWNKPLGFLGALGSCGTFIMTLTIIPFMPDGWNAAAGGFPAMQGNVAFLMKDLVLFAVSFYLLKQDADRALLSNTSAKTR